MMTIPTEWKRRAAFNWPLDSVDTDIAELEARKAKLERQYRARLLQQQIVELERKIREPI